jgi:hypothetical protein
MPSRHLTAHRSIVRLRDGAHDRPDWTLAVTMTGRMPRSIGPRGGSSRRLNWRRVRTCFSHDQLGGIWEIIFRMTLPQPSPTVLKRALRPGLLPIVAGGPGGICPVHTEEVTGSIPVSPTQPNGLFQLRDWPFLMPVQHRSTATPERSRSLERRGAGVLPWRRPARVGPVASWMELVELAMLVLCPHGVSAAAPVSQSS